MSETHKLTVGPGQVAEAPQYIDKQQPFKYVCDSCNSNITTELEPKIGSGTWVCALIWCNCFFFPGFIPFCVNSCKDQLHKCPVCKKILYKYHYEPCNAEER